MASVVAPPRIDERAMTAGTTVRFALLLVLLLVSSGSMMHAVINQFYGADSYGCLLAAGGDPNQGYGRANAARIAPNFDAFRACQDRYEPGAPLWLILLWPALLVTATVVLFRCLPRWKAWRGRYVPLEAIDHDGEIRRRLADFAAVAGLDRLPRAVVDLAAASTSAVVFGSDRRPIVCLHIGLLTRRSKDPTAFRAVTLHEFAHVRNGDVTLTYATIAAWRVFIALVLLPYVIHALSGIPAAARSPFWPAEAPYATRELLLVVVMVTLVYLARSDVLRNREIYADLAAVRWGADPRGWAFTVSGQTGGRLRRALGSFVELWRAHPRWNLRRDALADPAALFGVQALPMFLTGIAALLIDAQANRSFTNDAWAAELATALVAAGLTTGVAGIALWRAVAHAVLTGRRMPSGVRAGLWLGAGLVVGESLCDRVAVGQWVPNHPVVLALVPCAAAVFGWWTAQCAQLWVTAWPGRTIRPAMLLGLSAAWLVLTSWFAWWSSRGVLFADIGLLDRAGAGWLVRDTFGAFPGDDPAMMSTIGVAMDLLSGLDRPLVLAAVMVLWVVPLLAWTLRSATVPPRWTFGALGGAGRPAAPGEVLPPLRRVLWVASAGVLTCWAAVAAVMAYMHTQQYPSGQQERFYVLVYLAWTLVALVAGATAAAIAASVLARRYRLLVALIVAEGVALGGFAGHFALVAADGCVEPLNTLVTRCQWRPAVAWSVVETLLGYVLVLTAVATVIAAAIVSAVRRAWRSRAESVIPGPRSGQARGGPTARRLCAAVLSAAAVAATVTAAGQQKNSTGGISSSEVRRLVPVGDETVPGGTRRLQVAAWWLRGGQELQDRYVAALKRVIAARKNAVDSGNGNIDAAALRPVCADIGRVARDAGRYFPAPDPEIQALWRTFVTQAEKAGGDCRQGLEDGDAHLFTTFMSEINEAARALLSVSQRVVEAAQAVFR
ncbi:M48 family metalloprotease [Microbispora sp. H10836]|uniref:M48 family metalloprotease n=1 Tax=Microbispora sp. H10836 TaxID=2729106 RepID=UPI0014760056|nr:M48 family metalloprotease [Microbispora sp. H10836]